MDFVQALQSLMALFVEQLNTFSADIATIIKSKLRDWMCSQVAFIQALFTSFCWESRDINFIF